MTSMKGLLTIGFISVAVIGFSGCTKYASQEELTQMNQMKQEIASMETNVNTLKSEKTKLDREIAEKNAKLEQCAKDKAETKKNLEKLPK